MHSRPENNVEQHDNLDVIILLICAFFLNILKEQLADSSSTVELSSPIMKA